MFPIESTAHVVSLAPMLTPVMAVGSLLAFTDGHRGLGTVMASSSRDPNTSHPMVP